MRVLYLSGAVALVAAAIALSSPGGASAHGVSPATLTKAGWACFDVPGLGVHCESRGADKSLQTVTFLYFDTSDPTDTDAPFLGTELLVAADNYHGQPCPQEGQDEYTPLDLVGGPEIDFYACHHR